MHPATAIYGTPPTALALSPGDAVQFSPLMPAAHALEDQADASLASIVMLAPGSTIERRYAMAQALRALKPGAPFTFLAPSDKGGNRIAKELAQFGVECSNDSKNHYRICKGLRPAELTLGDAIAEGAPRLVETIGLWSQPGVFSWDRLDAGSLLLVSHLPPLSGNGADLGCGIGYLSKMALQSPTVTRIDLVDIDRRAVDQAIKNVGADRTAFHWADATQTALSGLDFVITNPPFHDGGIEDRTLGQAFIRAAAAMLKQGGTCWLVANRHLPYEAVMQPLFSRVTLHAEASGFKIYEAVK